MIDAHNPREDVTQNEALVDVVQTLQSMETKLMNLITGMKDEGMMAFTLTLNDDLQKTLSRFKRLKSGRKPEPFIPSLPHSEEFKKGQQQKKASPAKEQKRGGSVQKPPSNPPAAASSSLIDIPAESAPRPKAKEQAAAPTANLFEADF